MYVPLVTRPATRKRRPKFLADELDMVLRKALVAIVATSDDNERALFLQNILSGEEPRIKPIIFGASSSLQQSGLVTNSILFCWQFTMGNHKSVFFSCVLRF